MLAVVPLFGVSAALGSLGGKEQEESAGINVKENSKTVEASISALGGSSSSNRILETISHEERRFLLFNSRSLTGECRKLIHDV